jgi:hypothetical protein
MSGANPPSGCLRFTKAGNITAAEIIVFLPQSFRSRDALNRLFQSGMKTVTMTAMVNETRIFPKYPLLNNGLCAALLFVMRDQIHPFWTVERNVEGLEQDFKPASNDLTMSNMRLQYELFPTKRGNTDGAIDYVPFEALAIDVTHIRRDDDALDLTRCVIWALHNSGSGLMYPRDFAWITKELGGPETVRPANHDKEVFARWQEANNIRKNAMMRAKREIDRAKTRTTIAHQLAAEALARAENVQTALETTPPALDRIVTGALLIDTSRLPPPVPGPSVDAIEQNLAMYDLRAPDDSSTGNETPMSNPDADMNVLTNSAKLYESTNCPLPSN